MTDFLMQDLRAELATGNALVVVGSGVSLAVTRGLSVASWTGLILSGIERCEQVVTGLPEGFGDRVRAQVYSGDSDELINAAELITAKLGGRSGSDFCRWLRETVGSLSVADSTLVDAIHSLNVPIATTNYDDLLTLRGSIDPITWRNSGRFERFIRGRETGATLHLHGHWRDPESVILGARSYERALGDAAAQALLRAMQLTRTLIFVGCGGGLLDPNMGGLLAWAGTVMSESQFHHFVLATRSESESLRAMYADKIRVRILEYGEQHDELATFLRTLLPPRGVVSLSADGSSSAATKTASNAELPGIGHCIGREGEISLVVDYLLADESLPVAILGGPGFGKSTVALAALRDSRVAARFGDQRRWVSCSGACNRKLLSDALAVALEVPFGPDLDGRTFARLDESIWCILLDNFETPWEGLERESVEQFVSQLSSKPNVSLVVTMRGRQRPFGQRWHEAVHVLPLRDSTARDMFIACAGQQFARDPALDELLRAMDGIPLAIRLLAAQAEGQPSLAELLSRWKEERTALLNRRQPTSAGESLDLSIGLSFASTRMTDESRKLLSLLSLLPSGIATRDIDRLLPSGALSALAALRQVALCEETLGRTIVLEPIREFVRSMAAISHEDAAPLLALFLDEILPRGHQLD